MCSCYAPASHLGCDCYQPAAIPNLDSNPDLFCYTCSNKYSAPTSADPSRSSTLRHDQH